MIKTMNFTRIGLSFLTVPRSCNLGGCVYLFPCDSFRITRSLKCFLLPSRSLWDPYLEETRFSLRCNNVAAINVIASENEYRFANTSIITSSRERERKMGGGGGLWWSHFLFLLGELTFRKWTWFYLRPTMVPPLLISTRESHTVITSVMVATRTADGTISLPVLNK